MAGNEKVGVFAMAAARRTAPTSNVSDGLLTEASLSHMSRSAAGARSRTSTK